MRGHDRDLGAKDNGTGPVLGFTEYEWACFLAGAKRGDFDLPLPYASTIPAILEL